MKALFAKYTPEIILVVYVILFFLVKNPNSQFDRVLISDGKGYYGYLTAIFIYNDLDYSFIEDYEAKYYNHNKIKDFRQSFDGEIVNMYFPGLAFLFLPFFVIAHFLSILLGFPADGYSIIYQYALGFAAIFYLWAGLKFLQKLLLSFSFSKNHTAIILILIALGTNINYYTLKEGTMSHIYSFAVVSAFLFFVWQAATNFRLKPILLAAMLFGLILIIRPTNGLIVLLVPLIAGSRQGFIKLLKNTFSSYKVTIPVLALTGLFPFLMGLLWYLQSGHWIVYSYGEHGFDFLNPRFFKILFGFNKGWFIYTPIAFISLGGFIWLFRKNRFQFWWAFTFLLLFIYTQSSWFCWTFTSNFSNRTFIDIYPIIAILLGYFLLLIHDKVWLKKMFTIIFIFLLALNNFQFYQHYKYIFPPGEITFDIYTDSFARTVPTARVRFPEELEKSSRVFENDFENNYGWQNYGSVTDSLAYDGNFASRAGHPNDYSIGLLVDAKPLITSDFIHVVVSALVYSNLKYSGAQLIIQLENQGKITHYHPVYLHEFNRQNKWTYMEFSHEIPKAKINNNQLRVFFFNKNQNEFFLVDNLKVQVISFFEDPEGE